MYFQKYNVDVFKLCFLHNYHPWLRGPEWDSPWTDWTVPLSPGYLWVLIVEISKQNEGGFQYWYIYWYWFYKKFKLIILATSYGFVFGMVHFVVLKIHTNNLVFVAFLFHDTLSSFNYLFKSTISTLSALPNG